MSTVSNRPNVKLAKLFYKYADEIPRAKPVEELAEEPKKPNVEYEAYPPYNFSWLVENKIAGMGYPHCVANLNYLVDVGINHLITLSSEKVPPILECKRKLKWTEIGIKEFGAPTLKQVLQFIAICERAAIRGEVVGVHCRHGRGRTGTMLACYLVYFNNMAPERAVLTVRVQRPGSCETYEQEKLVCHYHDCVRGTIEKPDYRLVDDKLFFDLSMKYMYPDKEKIIDNIDVGGNIEDNTIEREKTVTFEDEEQLIKEKKKKRKKTKAMVINHKIYF